MKEKILSMILLITATKIMNRQEPHHAEMKEISSETGIGYQTVLEVCRELVREGRIEGGKTISDNWVKAK